MIGVTPWERRARNHVCPECGAPVDYPCAADHDVVERPIAHAERYIEAMKEHPDFASQREEYERMQAEGLVP